MKICKIVELCLFSSFALTGGYAFAMEQKPSNELAQKELKSGIAENDNEKVIAAIKAGADVNWRGNDLGESWLEITAERGQESIVEILLNAGAKDTSKALLAAAWEGKFNIVKMLLQAGADIYATDADGRTPLIMASLELGRADTFLRFHIAKAILTNLTQLTPDEKNLLKNWFLVDQRLRAEGKGLPKDLKQPIAQWIMRALAQEVQARIIRAGGLKALQEAKNQKNERLIKLLNDGLNLDEIEKAITQQQSFKNLKQLGANEGDTIPLKKLKIKGDPKL